MSQDDRIRSAERRLFSGQARRLDIEETDLDLPRADMRLRVLSAGAGPAIVLLHGVGLSSAAWLPLLPELTDYRLHLVDLPGHGLSSPVDYRRSTVRRHTIQLLDDLLDALDLVGAPVIGHPLGRCSPYGTPAPDRDASPRWSRSAIPPSRFPGV